MKESILLAVIATFYCLEAAAIDEYGNNSTAFSARAAEFHRRTGRILTSAAASNCEISENGEETCEFDTSNLRFEKNARIELSVSQKTRSIVICDNIPSTLNEGKAWYGDCQGDAGDANFVERSSVNKDGTKQVYGTVRRGDDICRFAPNADGKGQVTCKPAASYPEHASPKVDDDAVDALGPEGTFDKRRLDDEENEASSTRQNPVADVMVVWTMRAECRASGLSPGCNLSPQTQNNMRGLVDLAVAETNTAFELSGVTTSIRLVHAYRHPTYVERSSGNDNAFDNALSEITRTTDGILDDVHSKRAQFGADHVHMLIDDSSYCGLAWLGPRKDLMFAVTGWSCATGSYTFGHELGHNYGCEHDRGTEGACNDNSKNDYGWRDPQGRFRSIMAYSCRRGQCDNNPGGRCTKYQRFSGPNVFVNGDVVGSSRNNNVARINSRRTTVANFFEEAAPPSPPPVAAPVAPTPTPPTCQDGGACTLPKAFDYRGCASQSGSGITCQRWDRQFPHEHTRTPESYPNAGLTGNHCRNPDNDDNGLWCYTTDPDVRWEYCNEALIPECQAPATPQPSRAPVPNTVPLASPTVSPTAVPAPVVVPTAGPRCLVTGSPCSPPLSSDYRGCAITTVGGQTCQAWNAQTPHAHRYTPDEYPLAGLVDNYCRNPDRDENGLWCYTTDPNVRWDYCRVPPECLVPTDPPTVTPPVAAPVVAPTTTACVEPSACTPPEALDYRGCQSTTREGFICMRWDAQSPHAHSYTPDRFPNAGLQHGAFCRNPDGDSNGLWCYTTDPSKRWDYCNVTCDVTAAPVTASPVIAPSTAPPSGAPVPAISPVTAAPVVAPTFAPISDLTYRGCFVDNPLDRTLPVWIQGTVQYEFTVLKCGAQCAARGHRYFGVQFWGFFCFCGDSLPPQQVAETACNTPCFFFQTETCGGFNHNSVYELPPGITFPSSLPTPAPQTALPTVSPSLPPTMEPTVAPSTPPVAGPITLVTYVGCYLDTPDARTLPISVPGDPFTFTVEICTAECIARGHRYAGLQFYGFFCFCGDTLPPPTFQTAEANCNTPCFYQQTEFCGSFNINSIYELPQNVASYLGCFSESPNALSLPYNAPGAFIYTSESCGAACDALGYRLYGLQYYGFCYCGDVVPAAPVAEAFCNTPCLFNQAEFCGGVLHNSVYQLYRYTGCYQDDAVARTFPIFSTSDQFAETRQTCNNRCRALGYRYSALQFYGYFCFCGNDLPTVPLADAACDTPCFTELTQSCGGLLKNTVYEVYY